MRILGIDYGTKRIGLALSDETFTLARPESILPPKQFWKEVASLIEKWEVTKIVVGWPLNLSGKMTDKTREVETFIHKIKQITGLPVEIMDERFSSQFAQSNSKSLIDDDSAQIILQNFLNKNKSV